MTPLKLAPSCAVRTEPHIRRGSFSQHNSASQTANCNWFGHCCTTQSFAKDTNFCSDSG